MQSLFTWFGIGLQVAHLPPKKCPPDKQAFVIYELTANQRFNVYGPPALNKPYYQSYLWPLSRCTLPIRTNSQGMAPDQTGSLSTCVFRASGGYGEQPRVYWREIGVTIKIARITNERIKSILSIVSYSEIIPPVFMILRYQYRVASTTLLEYPLPFYHTPITDEYTKPDPSATFLLSLP